MPSTVYHFVTLVNGEPQCGCGGGESCCLYPWPNPGSPLYPTTGLPSAIVETEGFYNGGAPETYTHNAGAYKFTAASGRYIEAELGTGLWAWYDSSGSSLFKSNECLIGVWEFGSTPMIIEDQFLDNYQLDFDEGATHHSFTLTRQLDICAWSDTVGEGITLIYNDINYKYEISITNGATKNDPQDSPAGSYTPGAGSAFTNIVVS